MTASADCSVNGIGEMVFRIPEQISNNIFATLIVTPY